MAIKANVSFTQKLGQPDYGSVGAGCTLEIEMAKIVDHAVV